jgi:dephospho-CoA kinase
MLLVGLTGGIATGKSTVTSYLQQQRNLPVIDADLIARQVVEPGRPAYRELVETFGPSILVQERHDIDQSNSLPVPPPPPLDRARLGQLVFADAEQRRRLNQITHPRIRWEILRQLWQYWWQG